MSQHYFSTRHQGEAITVLLGWDRPLGHFFMVVERDEPRRGQSDYLYVNLDDPDAFSLPLSHFKARLAELGISVPASMFEQVALDQRLAIGNRQVVYQADGSFQG